MREKYIQDLKMLLRGEADNKVSMQWQTFWQRNLGVQARHSQTIQSVRNLLDASGIEFTLPDGQAFGAETGKTRLTFRLRDWRPFPSDTWFETVKNAGYSSESAVRERFVVQILKKLGYGDADIASNLAVRAWFGTSPKLAFADFGVFHDDDRSRALFIIEAKRPAGKGKSPFKPEHILQSASYAFHLHAPIWLLTSARETHVYQGRWGDEPKLISTFHLESLRQDWPDIVRLLSRESTIERAQAMLAK